MAHRISSCNLHLSTPEVRSSGHFFLTGMDPSSKLSSNSPRVGTRRTFGPPGVVFNGASVRESAGSASPLLHHVLPPTHRSMSIVLIGLPRNLIVLLDDVLKTRNNSCVSLSLNVSTDTQRNGIAAMSMSTLTSNPRDPIQNSSQNAAAPHKLDQITSNASSHVPGVHDDELETISRHVNEVPSISFKEFLFHPPEKDGVERQSATKSAETKKRTKLMLLPRAVMLLKSKNQFLKDIQFELMHKNKELDLYWDGLPKHSSTESSDTRVDIPGADEVKNDASEAVQLQNLLILRLNKRWNKPISMSNVLPARLGRKRSHREVEDDYCDKPSSEESERRSLDSQSSQSSQTSLITRSSRMIPSDQDASSITLA